MLNLKKYRELKGVSQTSAAKELGISRQTYNNYELGKRQADYEMLLKLAEYFDTTVENLLKEPSDDKPITHSSQEDVAILAENFDNIKPITLKRFPMLGEIACGEPIWADEDKESFVMADMDIDADFCLTAKGESMINARINNGDVVFIKKMPIVQNGEIAAVIIDNEATLKRFYYYPEKNKLVLNPENPAFEPLVYTNEELDEVRVLGKAVWFMSKL